MMIFYKTLFRDLKNDDDDHNDNILLFVRREEAFKYDLMRSNKKYKIIRKIS